VVVVATGVEGAEIDVARLLALCKERMPAYMIPARIDRHDWPLPRNANGKIDRKSIADAWRQAAATAVES
jgi:acyl-coenzyme A synthetase/AMP-(fatty) acid ligase